MHLISLFLPLSLLSTAAAADYNASTPTSDALQLQEFECRCGAGSFLSMPHANITRRSESMQCHSYKLIDARGTNEPQGVSIMFYPMLQSILAKVPDGVSLPVEYPAGVDQNTTSGQEFIIDTINQGLQKCPNQTYALFGYSQGATLILRTLEKLSSEAINSVSSVILVGNPYRVPDKLSNVNGTGQAGNDATVGLFVASATANNESIPQLSDKLDQSGKVLDYCLEGDGVCAPNPACSCILPAGHLSYGLTESVQTTAVEHVIARVA